MSRPNFSTRRKDDEVIDVLTAKPKLEKPPMYKVVLLNDDYTPQEFVVILLKNMFHMNHAKAMRIMLLVHTQGRGVCGIFPRDIAEMKASGVHRYAKQYKYPLQCCLEPE